MIPSTREVGISHKDWYPGQKRALDWIANSSARVLMLDAPTASGKTALLSGVQKMVGQPAYASMWSRQLQQQAHEEIGAPIIMGRQNFNCIEEGETCEFGLCDDNKKSKETCPFRIQLSQGQEFPLTILNYAVLLQYLGSQDLESRPWLFCDEGHKLEDALGNWLDSAFSRLHLEEIDFPVPLPRWTDRRSILSWAKEASECSLSGAGSRKEAAQWRRVKHTAGRAACVILAEQEIQVYERKQVIYVRVLWPLRYFRVLLNHFSRILIMSATLGDIEAMARDMKLEDYAKLELPSIIPAEQRPIYYRPITSLNNNATDLDYQAMACGIIEMIQLNFPHERGLVHVSSYGMATKLGKFLAKHGLRDRVITEGRRSPHLRAEWETRLDSPVLVSPAAGLGLDLPHLFPYQIIAKCPYPDLGDPVIRARMSLDQDWYTRKTASSLVQMAGRVARNPNDSGITVITDSTFERNVYEKALGSFPQWFKEALR